MKANPNCYKNNYKDLMNIILNDKEEATKYFKNLMINQIPIFKEIRVDKPIISILSFFPLPYQLQYDFFKDNKDCVIFKEEFYFFTGNPGDRILFANRRLPYYFEDPIPFSFPITDDKITNIIQSNIYYFEVSLGFKRFRKRWENECLSIGFGTPSINAKSQVGWCEKSWGFHSDDGCFVTGNTNVNFTAPWQMGETYGVGIKYISKFKYEIFLTKNGIIVNSEIPIEASGYLIPMIGLDVSYPIKINWGQEKFKFNLQKHLNSNKVLSHANTFLKNNPSINRYQIKPSNFKNNSFMKNIIKDFDNKKINLLKITINNNSFIEDKIFELIKNKINSSLDTSLIQDINIMDSIENDDSSDKNDITLSNKTTKVLPIDKMNDPTQKAWSKS